MPRITKLIPICHGVLSAPTGCEDAGVQHDAYLLPGSLPYQAPDFTRLEDDGFLPAIREGMRRHREEVARIAANDEAPTFENTLLALENSGRSLGRATQVFFALAGANTNETLQQAEEALAPELAAHWDEIHLDAALFARIDALHGALRQDDGDFGREERRLIELYYQRFVRAGAALDDAAKARLKALNQEESTLTTRFTNRLLAASRAGALTIDNRAQLEGMSAAEVDAAAEEAEARGLEGKWLLTLHNTTQQPALATLADRNVRERLFKASWTRAEHGDDNDTRGIVSRLAQLRAEKARLLDHDSYAAYAMADQMAQTPQRARAFMIRLVAPATARAREETAAIQALIDRQGGGFALAPWDRAYYAEQVRRERYALDDAQLRPYFELGRVLRDGVFYAAERLYGLSFRPRQDLPVYHPEVRVYEVFDHDGEGLGLFYTDYFKRDNKSGGAWMGNFVEQSRLLGSRPVIYNVANFTKPARGQPALLSFDDVVTLFHEFGHALHGFLSDVNYPSLSGTNVARDFVEFPSQINEHWALEPQVLARYARHHETGEAMPDELVAKIRTARQFNQGFDMTELTAAALLDLAWHQLPTQAEAQPVDRFEAQALEEARIALQDVPPRYRSSYFQHIWGGGYAAGYYAYLWAQMLADDGYQWFVEQGGLSRESGQRFRDRVLSQGNSVALDSVYRQFRGREPNLEPMLKNRGLD